jgi:hypothetical protein
MTAPTSEEPFPQQQDTVQAAPPPFESQATFPLTTTIKLDQLTDEIRAALHRQVNVAQIGPEDFRAPISEDNPAELAVSPGDVDDPTVTQTINDHEPDDGYGIAAHVRDFDALVARVANDPETALSAEDVEQGIRGLLLRESGRRATEVASPGLAALPSG